MDILPELVCVYHDSKYGRLYCLARAVGFCGDWRNTLHADVAEFSNRGDNH